MSSSLSSDITLLKRLYVLADEDLIRRYLTLLHEVDHIRSVAHFYIEHYNDSSFGVIQDLHSITVCLFSEIEEEISLVYRYFYDVHGVGESYGEEKRLVMQALFRERKSNYARRLGDVSHKLRQHFESINIEDPAPAVHRRVRQGFSSEYLNRLSKNVYRDMAVFLHRNMSCHFPFNATPVTFQYWDYRGRDSGEQYQSDSFHAEWKRSVLSECSSEADSIVGGFNSLKMSYWNIEFPDLFPIIGHEIAHMIIRDATGNLDATILSRRSTGEFGKLARYLTNTLQKIISHEFNSQYFLELEVLADLLAATRFGVGFVHAWFLEMLHADFESRITRDEHGRYCSPHEFLMKDNRHFESPSYDATVFDFSVYLRGYVLLKMFELSGGVFTTTSGEREYLRAFSLHLNNLLKLRTKNNERERESWRAMAMACVNAIKKSGFLQTLVDKRSDIHIEKSWFLRRQRLSRTLQDKLSRKHAGTILPSRDRRYLHTDVSWRLLWGDSQSVLDYIEGLSPGVLGEVKDEEYAKNYSHQLVRRMNKKYQPRRTATNLVQEDYLFRTANIHYLTRENSEDMDGRRERFHHEIKDEELVAKEYAEQRTRLHASGDQSMQSSLLDKEWLVDQFSLLLLFEYGKPHYRDVARFNRNGDPPKDDLEAYVLGRHDSFVLVRDGNEAPEKLLAYFERREVANKKIYCHRKSLRKTCWERLDMQVRQPLMIVLITLKGRSLRTFFGALFNDSLVPKGLDYELFTSEGAEDYVLVVYTSPSLTGEYADKIANACFQITADLVKNDYVASTEMLFTENVMDFSHHSSELEFAICVRLSDSFDHTMFMDEFSKRLDESNVPKEEVSLTTMSGQYDYLIRSTAHEDATRKLHDCLLKLGDGIKRIHTQISKSESF